LGGEAQPVVIDLGIAHVARFNADAVSGVVAGMLNYMAPEQSQGKEPIDGKADLYALGVIAYDWLSGELPLIPQGKDFDEQVRDLVRRSPKPLAAAREGLSPELQKFIMSLLAKKPRGRPANAQVVAQTFHMLADASAK
jgi:serine/threonine protein kinase